MIYLDNNATSALAPQVKDFILKHLDIYANPSSLHTLGKNSRQLLETARQQVAHLLGCVGDEVIFTSGGTESNNLAILGSLPHAPKGKNHIITTKVEHPSVLNSIRHCQKHGWNITYLPVSKDGLLDLNFLEKSISSHTFLVSVMYANNETGVIFPIDKISTLVKKHDALFHVDATQIIGRYPLNVQHHPIDLLTISAHKFHSLKGAGVLYVKDGTRITPLIHGGKQERNIRSGTENFLNIIAMGQASYLAKTLFLDRMKKVEQMRNDLQDFILQTIPQCAVNGINAPRIANTLNVSFSGVLGDVLVRELSRHNVYVSHGAACSSGAREVSHVLKNMKLEWDSIISSIRFSFSTFNTQQQVEELKNLMPQVVNKLRNMPE